MWPTPYDTKKRPMTLVSHDTFVCHMKLASHEGAHGTHDDLQTTPWRLPHAVLPQVKAVASTAVESSWTAIKAVARPDRRSGAKA